MAIRELDLPQPTIPARPALRVVEPAPPRGKPLAALLAVVAVAGVLAAPVLRADRSEPARQSWPEPHLSSAGVATLDGGSATFDGSRPTSSEPMGGMLFVRCTRLWAAHPDGSHPRKLLDMIGISSPAFSPDARSVAFFAPSGDAPAIWLASAEGDHPRPIARLTTDGRSISAMPSNLVWSDNGKRLAFALVDPRFDPFGAGSSIWTFDLATGDFEREAQGWPAPFFLPNRARLEYASRSFGDGAGFYSSLSSTGRSTRDGRLSSDVDDYTAAFVNRLFGDSWTLPRGAVTLRDLGGSVVISVKRNEWRRGIVADHLPPEGHEIDISSRLALAQDGSRVLVDLFGSDGRRDLGILDLRSGDWAVLDYAWDGATSPAPTASGPLKAQRAERFAADLIGSMRTTNSRAFSLLGGDEEDRAVIPFKIRGQVLRAAVRSGNDWVVPASVIGKVDRRSWAARDVRIVVSETRDGRLVTDAEAEGAIAPIETIEDAVRVAATLVGDRFRWPSYIPDGARLNARWPMDAWSWDGSMTVSVNLEVPAPPGNGSKGYSSMSVVHGDDVGFNLGCGGVIDPEEGTVATQPALFDETGPGPHDTKQVLWPATLEREDDAFYTVYGAFSRTELTRIAESMAR